MSATAPTGADLRPPPGVAPALIPERRPPRLEAIRAVLAGAVFACLLRVCLELYERDARLIERTYGLTPDHQYTLGYRSAPESLRWRVYRIRGRDAAPDELREYAAHRHAWLDALPDGEFLDWFTYAKGPLANPLAQLQTRTVEYGLHQSLIECELQKRFGLVSGVPGLYHDRERLRTRLAPLGSVIAAARVHGLMRTLYYYPRPGEAKCYPVSSKGLPGGAAARHSIHIAHEARARASAYAVICPHTIAADAKAEEDEVCAVAVNGLWPDRFVRQLQSELPCVRGVVLTADCAHEPLARALREQLFEVESEVD